jgi:hypothetical protein
MSDPRVDGPGGPQWAAPGTAPEQPTRQAVPAPAPAPGGYGQQAGHAAYPPAWGTALTAHKPGIVPLRPLGFGDILEGAFAALRRNPKAFLGLALLTSLVVLLIFGALAALAYIVATQLGDSTSTGAVVVGLVGGFTLVYAVTAITSVALTGILAYPVGEGVLGRRPSAGETWRRTRRMVPRLAGLCLVLFVPTVLVIGGLVALAAWAFSSGSDGLGGLAVFGVVATVLALAVVAVRLAMSTPALVLEDLGVVASLRRSWALTRGRFWRTLGMLVVAGLLVGLVQQVVGFGVQVVGTVLGLAIGSTLAGENGEAVTMVVTVAFVVVGSLVASMVCQPFLAAVTALLYTDARIRKEGFDLALVRAVTGRGAAG